MFMSSGTENFEKLVKNQEKSLRSLIKDQKLDTFSTILSSLYPFSSKFFQTESQEQLKKNKMTAFLNKKMKKDAVAASLLIRGYDVQKDRIVVVDNDGVKKEYALADPINFINLAFSLKEEDDFFYFYLSYLIQPLNYDAFQLFMLLNQLKSPNE